jgi:hypothetical protein
LKFVCNLYFVICNFFHLPHLPHLPIFLLLDPLQKLLIKGNHEN